MNRVAAYQLATSELDAYRILSFDDLYKLLGEQSSRIVRTDGVDYKVAVAVQWRALNKQDAICVWVRVNEANQRFPYENIDESLVVFDPASKSGGQVKY